MELQDFIKNFAYQMDDMDVKDLSSETEFRELDEWSSLTSLAVIAMIDDEYDVSINGNDIRSSKTIGDLYNIVKYKKNV